MSRFAEKTNVDTATTRADIERILVKYGADSFAYGWQDQQAMVSFVIKGLRMRFVLPMPDRKSRVFTHTEARNKPRSDIEAAKVYEQSVRSRWRALYLVIRAKLEAVETKITTMEDEFMAHIVLPDGDTVGDWMKPQIAQAYKIGTMPSFLQIGESK